MTAPKLTEEEMIACEEVAKDQLEFWSHFPYESHHQILANMVIVAAKRREECELWRHAKEYADKASEQAYQQALKYKTECEALRAENEKLKEQNEQLKEDAESLEDEIKRLERRLYEYEGDDERAGDDRK